LALLRLEEMEDGEVIDRKAEWWGIRR